MNLVIKKILLIVLLLAVLGYTVYNYTTGGSHVLYFIVAALILLFPLINITRSLIDDLKNRE